MTTRILFFVLLAVTGVVGCAEQPATPTASTQPHAECLVCKHNADLACVDVTVDATTPHTAYDGKTYYFCSDQCRKDFDKEPAKYAKP